MRQKGPSKKKGKGKKGRKGRRFSQLWESLALLSAIGAVELTRCAEQMHNANILTKKAPQKPLC